MSLNTIQYSSNNLGHQFIGFRLLRDKTNTIINNIYWNNNTLLITVNELYLGIVANLAIKFKLIKYIAQF